MDQVSIRKLFVLFGVASIQAAWVPQVDACCLTDWLFKRRTPTVAYYGAAPAPMAAAAPVPTAPVTPGSSCGPGYCEETVVRYVPEVAYRTVWQPVPVTTYKRTVNYNPATGLPITCTQPCTTYTYQARRVPYTTFRPVYTQVPLSAPATPVMTTPISTVPVAASSGCNTCATPVSPTYAPYSGGSSAAPYYPPSAATTADPAGATPWEPVAPTQAAPGSSDWAPPYGNSGTADPADQKPRIDPDAGNSFSSLRLPSTPAPYNTWNRANPYGANGELYGSSSSPSDVPSSGTWSSADESRWSNGTRGNANAPSTVSPVAPFELRPLPNYERQPEAAGTSVPPPLDTGRDRTAMVRPIPTRWDSTPIAWPERLVQHTVERSVPETTPVRQLNYRRLEPQRIENQQRFDSDSQSSPWDQSGWRSANR